MHKVVILSLVIFLGCSAGQSSKAENTSDTTVASEKVIKQTDHAADQQAMLNLTHGQPQSFDGLTISLVKIADSRCPTGEQCIWAGQVAVDLQVTNTDNSQQTIQLIYNASPQVVSAYAVDFSIMAVTPHPKKGKTIQPEHYRVKLKLTK